MRLNSPRILPVATDQWSEAQQKVLAPFAQRNQLFNIYTTLARNPDALTSFLSWGSFVLRRSSLNPRQRELVILRVGYLCRAGYEWAQHSKLGKQVGLLDTELAAIKVGPNSPTWTHEDRVLLLAADELHKDYFVSNATWPLLREFLTEQQAMDLVFVVAHYTQVCMILNTFGIQLDDGLELDEDLRA